jgi:4-hydroxyphenylacetate 3-monooxygenase
MAFSELAHAGERSKYRQTEIFRQVATDTGNGGFTMRFFRSARTAKDLVADRDAIAAWARLTYGWMGRSPDYKASFLGTLGANADFYTPFQDNARRWYRESQEGSVLELSPD